MTKQQLKPSEEKLLLNATDNYESLAEGIATSGGLLKEDMGTNGMDEGDKLCICCGKSLTHS